MLFLFFFFFLKIFVIYIWNMHDLSNGRMVWGCWWTPNVVLVCTLMQMKHLAKRGQTGTGPRTLLPFASWHTGGADPSQFSRRQHWRGTTGWHDVRNQSDFAGCISLCVKVGTVWNSRHCWVCPFYHTTVISCHFIMNHCNYLSYEMALSHYYQ